MKSIEDAAISASVYCLVGGVSEMVDESLSLLAEMTKNSGSDWGHEDVAQFLNHLRHTGRRALGQLGGERKVSRVFAVVIFFWLEVVYVSCCLNDAGLRSTA